MYKQIAIAGIHTGIGKTIASAVLAEALAADYWKPIQAGELDNSDTKIVSSLISNGTERVHPEAFRLTQPMSPHAAAEADGVVIDYKTLQFPDTDKTLLIETAGGLLSPLYGNMTMADFISFNKLPAILVSSNYLGSINHTLLTIEVMKRRDIQIVALIMCGNTNKASEDYIENYSGIPIAASIPFFEQLTGDAIRDCAINIKEGLLQHLQYEQAK